MDQAEIARALGALPPVLNKLDENFKGLRERVLDLEQRGARVPGAGGRPHTGNAAAAEIAELVHKSDGLKAFAAGNTSKFEVRIPRELFNTAITSPTPPDRVIVGPDRRQDIVAPAQRRFTIRDLFMAVPTTSNLIEFCRELAFTSNAGPQHDASSPTAQSEGAVKNESGMTFELATAPVVTLAHWIPASRQILSDAPLLQRYIEGRLLYGLKLEEEDELLNSSGANGELNGLVNQATAFTGGSTNQTALDTLAKAATQLAVTEHMATGFILNPVDWQAIVLSKDSQGRYLIGDPQQAAEPRLWGLPVAVTNTMGAGTFVCLDAPRAGFIADREDAVLRISESHADFFIRNLVALLCEERLTLVVERSAAIIYGSLDYAG